MIFTKSMLFAILLAAVALMSFAALGQEAALSSTADKAKLKGTDVKGKAAEMETGWKPLLKASGNFSLGHNQNVAGNPDGVNLSFGYLINGGLLFLNESKEHEWQNNLAWQLGYMRTPIIDQLIKNADSIDFKSSYLYHIPAVTWMGPFASFQLKTSMLPSDAVYAEDKTILKLRVGEAYGTSPDGLITDGDGNPIGLTNPRTETVTAGTNIPLTRSFAPTTLREGAGWFFIPLDKPEIKIDTRIGLGVWETFVRKGYTVADNADTTSVLELQQMQDYDQLGPEWSLKVNGVLEKMVTYQFDALVMYPAWNNADTKLSGVELINTEFDFLLGVQLWTYVTLDYAFKAYYQPLLIEEWQIQNALLLSVVFNIVG